MRIQRIKKKAIPAYDEFKEFERKKYTGMKIGRTHSWHYEQGEWKEKKASPRSMDI